MSWFSDAVGSVSKAVTKHVVPAVAEYGGAVVGGAVGTVVGGPAGTIAGAAAGRAASKAIQGAVRGATRRKRRVVPAKKLPKRVRAAVRARGKVKVRSRRTGQTVTIRRLSAAASKRVRAKKRAVMKKAKAKARAKKSSFRNLGIKRAKSKVPAMVIRSGAKKGDALATAGRLIASIQSADPRLRAYAKAVMNATALRARAGDVSAQRAVSALKTAQSANKSKGRLTGFLVTNSGRVVIGSFLQTG